MRHLIRQNQSSEKEIWASACDFQQFGILTSVDSDEPVQPPVKGIHFVIYGIISEFTDKGQFQYLTNLKGPQEGTYLYTTQFLLSQR